MDCNTVCTMQTCSHWDGGSVLSHPYILYYYVFCITACLFTLGWWLATTMELPRPVQSNCHPERNSPHISQTINTKYFTFKKHQIVTQRRNPLFHKNLNKSLVQVSDVSNCVPCLYVLQSLFYWHFSLEG